MIRITNFKLVRKVSLFLFLIGLTSSVSFADNLRVIREKSFQVKDWQNVYVNASGADVKVESWDKQEVYVKISANRNAEEKMRFDIYQEGDVVKVIAKKRGSFFTWFGNSFNVRIEIMAPKKFNTHVETSGGDIKVYNLTGGFRLDTSGGDISLSNTEGKVSAETSGGDITLSKQTGSMNLSTSGGDIICTSAAGDLFAETSGGDIKVDLNEGKLHAETSGGDITILYSGVNRGITAETSGGDIKVKLPSDFKAKVHLETSGGGIHNNFSNSRSERVTRGEVDAEFNGGGDLLRLETSGGEIRVEEK